MPTVEYDFLADQDIDRITPAPFALEHFVKADGDPLGPVYTWTDILGDFENLNNTGRVVGTDGNGNAVTRNELNLGIVDHAVEATMTSFSARQAVCVRMAASATTFLMGAWNNDTESWEFWRCIAGAFTNLTFLVGLRPVLGDTIRVVARGTSFELWHNKRFLFSVTDSTAALQTGTRVGLYGQLGSAFGQVRPLAANSWGPWRAALLGEPTITRSTREPYFGVLEPDTVEWTQRFRHHTPAEVLSWREKPFEFTWWDRFGDIIAETFTGVVSKTTLARDGIRLRGTSIHKGDLTTEIPKGIVAGVDFPSAVDVGLTPAVVFGQAARVPMRYVHRDLIGNVYRYIARGNCTASQVYRSWQDNTLWNITPGEYTVSTVTYPGYTTLQFPQEQIDFNGGNHLIYADLINTDTTTRNFIWALYYMITNATWGLGKLANLASFTAAAAVLDGVGGLFCDGFMDTARAAQDYLRMCMMVRGIRIWINAVGEYEVSVETGTDAIAAVFGEGPGDGARNILDASEYEGSDIAEAIKRFIIKYRRDIVTGAFTAEIGRDGLAFGTDWAEENIFVSDHGTADRIAYFISALARVSDPRMTITVGQQGRLVQARQRVRVTYPKYRIFGQTMRVVQTKKNLDAVELEVRNTGPEPYAYQAGTLPTDPSAGGFDDYSRVVPANVTGLTVFSAGAEATASDGGISAWVVLTFNSPVGSSASAKAYRSARIDFKPTAHSSYQTGYAIVNGTGALSVKVSGLVPGLLYDYRVVSLTAADVPSAGIAVTSQLAVGDATGPVLPGTPTSLGGGKLSTITFYWEPPADKDLKEFDYEIRTGANGTGTLLLGAPSIRIGVKQVTIEASAVIGYGVIRYFRVRPWDFTGNPGPWSFSTSFAFSRTVPDDYGNATINTIAIVNAAITTGLIAVNAVSQLLTGIAPGVTACAAFPSFAGHATQTITTAGGTVFVVASCFAEYATSGASNSSIAARIRNTTSGAVSANGTMFAQAGIGPNGVTLVCILQETPAAGTYTYQIEVTENGTMTGAQASSGRITVTEFKR